jgi:hypothetical protein
VERPIGQAPHLRVPALAGVTADGVRQLEYPVERLQERPAEEASAILAAGRVMAEGSKLMRLAERADNGMCAGDEGVFHLLVLSDRLGLPPVMMPHELERDIAQMSDFFLVNFM